MGGYVVSFFLPGGVLLPYDHGLDYDISLLCEDSIYQFVADQLIM